MSSDLLQKLGLPRTQVAEVLTRLATNKKVIERKKDGPLLAHLKSLRIAHCAGRLWHLDNPERLDQLRQQIGLEEEHATKARGAIVRNTKLVHHKCAAAWRGDSKSGRSEPLLPTQAVTSDEVIRVRSSKTGLTVTYPDWQQSVDEETKARSECTIPERLWREKHRLSFADIKLIMTVENLGAFVDLPLVEGLVLLYVPGLNLTHTELLASLPATVPWVAFPDYDPNGLSIVQTMANKLGRPARIWLPDYWQDQAAQRSREIIGASKRGWLDAPSLSLPGLRDVQRWLEQEVLVLDHRCDAALNDLVSDELGIVTLNELTLPPD